MTQCAPSTEKGTDSLFLFAAILLPCVLGSTTHQVAVGANSTLTFFPANITITAGDVVQWIWASGNNSVVSGNITACTPSGVFATNVTNPPFNYSFTFTNAGVYPYYSGPHCEQGQIGEIIVFASSTTTGNTTGTHTSSTSSTSTHSTSSTSTTGSSTTTSGAVSGVVASFSLVLLGLCVFLM